MERLYGLIGFPLDHSFSAGYFSEKFDKEGITGCRYQNFPLENITDLPTLLAQNTALRSFNVTIPYKETVLPYLHALSPEAQVIGAVNCVKITPQGLIGYNTDAAGFKHSLLDFLGPVIPNRALVLGTGGASKAVAYVLSTLNIPFSFVSRQSRAQGDTHSVNLLGYDELTPKIMASHQLIINATPLGTFPNIETCPRIPYDQLTSEHNLFDLVYNPSVTEFLRRGSVQGAATCNGYQMLVGQAEKAWSIWNTPGNL